MTGGASGFLLAAALFCLAASAAYAVYLRTRDNDHGFWAAVLAFTGWVVFTLSGLLSVVEGHPLFYSSTERVLFFFWIAFTVFLVATPRWSLQLAGAVVLPFVTSGIIWALLQPSGPTTLEPLRSAPWMSAPWMALHMTLVFTGYSSFMMAGVAAGLYLFQERELKAKRLAFMRFEVPSLSRLDTLSRRLIAIGFPLLTLGIAAGGMVAKEYLGTFWFVDAKVIGSLAVWAFYGIYLLVRFVNGWQGRRLAIWSLVGFLAVLFNFFGLSWLAPGFHRFG